MAGPELDPLKWRSEVSISGNFLVKYKTKKVNNFSRPHLFQICPSSDFFSNLNKNVPLFILFRCQNLNRNIICLKCIKCASLGVGLPFVLIVFYLFVIFIYFPFWFKSGIWLLIAPVSVH